MPNSGKTLHLHLVSDSTGETIATVARASLVQFPDAHIVQHLWYLVRTEGQIDRVLTGISKDKGLVLFTMVDKKIRRKLEKGCMDLAVPAVSVLDPVMSGLTNFLGKGSASPGQQHVLDAAYYRRIDAIEFTIRHDDGASLDTLEEADIVLVGVSRSSKTPTCTYLANRGYKVANVPLVQGIPLPEQLMNLNNPVVVGLTRDAKGLSEIRRNRLRHLNKHEETNYSDIEIVTEEVKEAKRLFARRGWPVIDVSRRSIEEAAASIIEIYHRKYPELPEE